jgi:hypothetical protein
VSALERISGLAVAAFLGAVYLRGLESPPQDLYGTLPGARPYSTASTSGASAAVEVGPPSLLPRITHHRWGAPSLALDTWSTSYGNRWHRSITTAELRGPLEPASAPWCGLAVRISPGMLDPAQAGDGMVSIVEAELDKVLPMTLPCGLTSVYLSRPKSVKLELVPKGGQIHLQAVATLNDGTRVGGASAIRLGAVDGRLHIERTGGVTPLFDGPGRAACEGSPLVKLGNLWWRYVEGHNESIVMSVARAEMTRRVTPALDAINASLQRLHEPFALFEGGPQKVTFRLTEPPVVDERGIALRLCGELEGGAPMIDATITGPPASDAPPPPMPDPGSGARIDVALNAPALNRMLHVLWQMGELRRRGTSTEILDQLPDDIRKLAFEVTGFDPQLPPILHGSPLHVTAGNIAIGTWDDRTVFGFGTGALRLSQQGRNVIVTAAIDELSVSCAARAATGWNLTPCLSDLLPLVEERMKEGTPQIAIDTGPLIERMAAQTLHGLSLDLGDPEVRLDGAPRGDGWVRASLKAGVRSRGQR